MPRPESPIPIRRAMQQIQDHVNGSPALLDRGRLVSGTVMLQVGEEVWRMKIREGRINSLEPGPFVMPEFTFRLAAPEPEWQRFWQAVPPPGSHDLFALLKRRVLQIDGDLHLLMSNLFYFKFMLAAPRRAATLSHADQTGAEQ